MESNYWMRAARRRASRRVVLGGAAVGVGAAFVGCGDDGDKKTATATAAGSAPASAAASGSASPKPSATAVDLTKLSEEEFLAALPENPPKDWTDAEIKTGGKLGRATRTQPAGLDPITGQNFARAEAYQPVYNKLIRLSCAQGLKSVMIPVVEPDLAVSWERPDNTTITFKLAPNIKWQNKAPVNGRPFTASDVVYGINRVKTSAKSAWKSQTSFIQSVSALSDGQVQIKLDKPNLAIEEQLAPYYMSILPKEIGEDSEVALNTAVGTGGMILARSTPNAEWVFEKNPDFFKTDAQGRKKPYLDGYSLLMFNDMASETAAFETKQIDFAYSTNQPVLTGAFGGAWEFYKRNPKTVMQIHPPANASFCIIGHYDKAPWSDPRVRQAFSLAMPREKIIKALYQGRGFAGPFYPWPFLFEKAPGIKELGPNFAYDPQKAKQLLAAAGFPNGIELELNWYSTVEQQALALESELQAGGVKLKLVKDADLTASQQRLQQRSWKDLIIAGRGLNFIDPAASWPAYTTGGALNFSDVKEKAFDDLARKLEDASAPDDRKKVGREMWDQLTTGIFPEVPLPRAEVMHIWQPTVQNIVDCSWGPWAGVGMGQMDSVWRRG